MTALTPPTPRDENILLAIAPAVFLGNDTLFEQLERVILTPDNLFDAPPNKPVDGVRLDRFKKRILPDEQPAQFPLPSFYDFLTLGLSHLPYLAPQQLIALPHRFSLPPHAQDKTKYYLLPFQQSLIDRWLTPYPAVNKFLIIMLAGIIIRSFTAIDPNSITDEAPRAAVTTWRHRAVEQLRGVINQPVAMPRQYLLFGRSHQLYHLTALHQEFARTNLAIYDRMEQSLKHQVSSSDAPSLSQKIKDLLRGHLPGKLWLQNKKIHYHLLELQTLPRQLSLPLPSPFLTLVNLASLTHWLINGTGEAPKKIVQDTIARWRQELSAAADEKNQTRLYDHYPVYGEVLEKIDGQLKSMKNSNIKNLVKKTTKTTTPATHKTINPLTLKDNRFILSMVGHNMPGRNHDASYPSLASIKYFLNRLLAPARLSSYLLPWQKSAWTLPAVMEKKYPAPDNISNHLMMTFDVMFKKKSFIESGVWLSPEPHKKKLLSLFALAPKIAAPDWRKKNFKRPQPSHYYIDNSLQLGGSPLAQPNNMTLPPKERLPFDIKASWQKIMRPRQSQYPKKNWNAGAWRYVRCQKILLPDGDMLYSKKIHHLHGHHDNRVITIERKFFMPQGRSGANPSLGDAQKPQVYLKALEKIIAPGGIDFMLLLPLAPTIKAFGRSDSLIHELEQHWQRPMKKNDQRLHGGVIIEPLIPYENPDDSLSDKVESLQEVFLQSSDKPGGRLVARGATLSLTKGVFLNDFIEEPCQVIMLSGQTTPGETIINWVLELVA